MLRSSASASRLSRPPAGGGLKAFKTAMSRPADGYTIFDGCVAPLVLRPIQGNADWNYTDFTPL